MGLIPGICTQCGATLSVDEGKDAMVCPYCNTPFVVGKAIQNFNNTYNITNNITAQNVYVQDGKQDFEIVGGVLKKYNGVSLNIIIPNNVTVIGEDAFRETKIESVSMSNNVTEIRSCAFLGCDNLESVTLSDKLEKIGHGAFARTCLLKLYLPDSIRYIDDILNAFTNCLSIHISSELLNKFNEFPAGASEIYLDNRKLELSDLKNNQALRRKFWHTKLGQELLRIEQQEQQEEQQKFCWRHDGQCQYCGGRFSGFFTKICSKCGKAKDY